MRTSGSSVKHAGTVTVVVLLSMLVAGTARPHCDTLDGPVVKAARTALEKGDVTPVLRWASKESEAEVREAFKKTLAVRAKGPEARELADMYFFETVVRIHRAGEGAPYTGLKPAGFDLSPAVVEADKALEKGSVDALVRLVTDAAAAGVRQRFTHASEAKKHAEESVEAGREFVAAYIEFVHYTERLYQDSIAEAAHHGEEGATSEPAPHGAAEKTKAETEHRH